MGWIGRLVVACVVAVVVYILLAWLIGPLLLLVGIPFVTLIGEFIIKAALVIAICVLLYYFFAGGFTLPNFPRRPPPPQ